MNNWPIAPHLAIIGMRRERGPGLHGVKVAVVQTRTGFNEIEEASSTWIVAWLASRAVMGTVPRSSGFS